MMTFKKNLGLFYEEKSESLLKRKFDIIHLIGTLNIVFLPLTINIYVYTLIDNFNYEYSCGSYIFM